MNPYAQETHFVCAKHLRELGGSAPCCVCTRHSDGCSFEGTEEDLKPSEEKKDWEDEFEKEFPTLAIPSDRLIYCTDKVKSFISKAIASAVEAERARIKQEVQTIIDTKGYESGDVVLGVIKFLESI